jgi:capsular polysaccharide biosynthesis protein
VHISKFNYTYGAHCDYFENCEHNYNYQESYQKKSTWMKSIWMSPIWILYLTTALKETWIDLLIAVLPLPILLGGDQLTAARVRGSQERRMTSTLASALQPWDCYTHALKVKYDSTLYTHNLMKQRISGKSATDTSNSQPTRSVYVQRRTESTEIPLLLNLVTYGHTL